MQTRNSGGLLEYLALAVPFILAGYILHASRPIGSHALPAPRKGPAPPAAVLPKPPKPPAGVVVHTARNKYGFEAARWWTVSRTPDRTEIAVTFYPEWSFEFANTANEASLSFWQIDNESGGVVASSETASGGLAHGVTVGGYPETVRMGNGPLLEPNPLNFMVNLTMPPIASGHYVLHLIYNGPGYTSTDWTKTGRWQGGGYAGHFSI